jgi:hypothetical protein
MPLLELGGEETDRARQPARSCPMNQRHRVASSRAITRMRASSLGPRHRFADRARPRSRY